MVQTDAFTRFLLKIDPFLQRAVVEEAFVCEEFAEVPLRAGVELGFICIRVYSGTLS